MGSGGEYEPLGQSDVQSLRSMGRGAGDLRVPLAEAGSKSPAPRTSQGLTKAGKCPVTSSDTFTSGSRVWFLEPSSHLTKNTRGAGWVGAAPKLGSIGC